MPTTTPIRRLIMGAAPRIVLLATVACCPLSTSSIAAGESLAILPASVRLTGPEARQRLLVEEVSDFGFIGEIAEGVTLTSSDPAVVRIDGRTAVPVGDGRATVSAAQGERSAQCDVTVTGMSEPFQWSFRNHVQSVLSKMGCNSGACHGAAAGKNGFKLSLRGYDPEADFFTITRQSRGRRIVPEDPARSLVLTKPTGAIPHKGGVRFSVDSKEYRALAEWIASGQPGPAADDPRLMHLEVLPEHVVLKPGMDQQLIVRAHFDDGHVEDVTSWAKYTSTDLSVAKVDDLGSVSVTGSGEGSVVAWYLSQNVVGSVSVPYLSDLSPDVFREAGNSNFIDRLVMEKLRALNIAPSPRSTDFEFVRRAYLDTIGVLPTVEQTRAFLADESIDKRDRLVDHLLSRPEFVDYWSYKWSDLLLVTSATLSPNAARAYYGWIREQVAENRPWDEFARQLITTKGGTLENGAASFYTLHEDPQGMSETVSMAFLGMSINCARCHDHPLEKWTNDDYYGMANLFSRVRAKDGNGDGNRIIFTAATGELMQPRTGRPQTPRPLDGESLPFDSTADRRIHLADWLTSPDNPYFSRAIVNRVWANFLGVGIVEKVDDVRLTNPPSNAELLSALAGDLAENGYDLKRLMRLILTSETYQRSSQLTAGNEEDERFYSRYYPRRLPAEVLLDAVSQVSGVPTAFADQPAGTRALQLADSNVDSYFLKTFGRPERLITCECERSAEPTMVQVLHIVNGDTINAKLETRSNRIDEWLDARMSDEQIVEQLYLAALSRHPTSEESSQILQLLDEVDRNEKLRIAEELDRRISEVAFAEDDGQKRKALDGLHDRIAEVPPQVRSAKRNVLEDLVWSVLSSKEFLFNH